LTEINSGPLGSRYGTSSVGSDQRLLLKQQLVPFSNALDKLTEVNASSGR
jgi:hypothetical protein